jgi:hypothetical protein
MYSYILAVWCINCHTLERKMVLMFSTRFICDFCNSLASRIISLVTSDRIGEGTNSVKYNFGH